MKRLINLWWNANTIIGKILNFVYESQDGVSENELKTFINNSCSEKKILSLHSSSCHTQKNTGLDDFPITNLDGNYYTALDLKIFSMALSIRSFSVYFWGSGFSSWISKIYEIPFYCKPLIKPLF